MTVRRTTSLNAAGVARRRRAGFTLLEICVSVFLVVLCIGLGFAMGRSARSKTSVSAVVRQLVADIRWALSKARGSGRTVGLVFAGPSSQSMAIVTTEATSANGSLGSTTEVLKVENWADESPEVFVAGSPGGWWISLSSSVRRASDAAPNVSLWSGDDRPVLALSPTGAVLSRMLLTDGKSNWLVVRGGGSTDESSFTIEVTPLGEVRSYGGLPPNMVGSEFPRPATFPALPAALTRPTGRTGSAVQDPVVTLKVAPDSAQTVMSGGSSPVYTVREDSTISLVAEATDADGAALYCSWGAATEGSGSQPAPRTTRPERDDASFSQPSGWYTVQGLHKMSLKTDGATFTSTTEWSPPASAHEGDWFALCVLVDDLRGGRTCKWIVVGIVGASNQMVINSNVDGPIRFVQMNKDGTDRRDITMPPNWGMAHYVGSVSPDGQRIAYVELRGSGGNVFVVQNIDRTNKRDIYKVEYYDSASSSGGRKGTACPFWTPDSTKVIALTYDPNTNLSSLTLVATDGSSNSLLLTRPDAVDAISYSPDGTKLVYNVTLANGNKQVILYDVATKVETTLLASNGVGGAQWSCDCKTLVYCEGGSLYTMSSTGTDKKLLCSMSGYYIASCSVSQDGQYISFSDNVKTYLITAAGLHPVTHQPGVPLCLSKNSWDWGPAWMPR